MFVLLSDLHECVYFKDCYWLFWFFDVHVWDCVLIEVWVFEEIYCQRDFEFIWIFNVVCFDEVM